VVHVQVGEDGGDGDGMRDVRLAGHAALALVGGSAEQIRLVDFLDLRFREVETELGK
jgi:hypothetical protein